MNQIQAVVTVILFKNCSKIKNKKIKFDLIILIEQFLIKQYIIIYMYSLLLTIGAT